MNPTEAKQEEVDRLDLLYDPDTLYEMHSKYGGELDIKRRVKTAAKVYEIRTAIFYWFEHEPTYRTCDCTWERIAMVDQHGVDPAEADAL